jgi:hypothetical protein
MASLSSALRSSLRWLGMGCIGWTLLVGCGKAPDRNVPRSPAGTPVRSLLTVESHADFTNGRTDYADPANHVPDAERLATVVDSEAVTEISRTGSPEAVHQLLEVLVNLPDGDTKSDLCRQLALGSRPELHPWLFRVFLQTEDADLSRALSRELAPKATASLLAQVIETHDGSSEASVRSRALDFLRECSGDESVEVLTGTLRDHSRPVSEPVNSAIATALATNGSAIALDTLLARLSDTQDSGEAQFMTELVRTISRPETQSQLIGAARGNKVASTVASRVASIRALANYPTLETLEEMQRLTQDPDPRIQRASAQIVLVCQGALQR